MTPITDGAITGRIEGSREQTIQSHIRSDPTNNMGLVWWMAKAGYYLSPWWSPARDRELREFWKKTDHLSGAVFTMTAKMTAIPFKVVPRNTALKDHVKQARKLTEILSSASQFGEGWTTFYSRWIEDLITQDNGCFAEIIGPGSPSGPLTGRISGLAHLDASRCTRTANPEFPVIYTDFDGKMYKLHYSRVLYSSQMSSPISDMNGVGFCSVSRCVNVAQTLLDILLYKQEKLGSRPHRAVIITKGGLDPQDLASAFQMAEGSMDNQGMSRYSKIVVAGSSTIEDASHEMIELSQLPDGFDEETSVTLGMATIALAFGVDPRELFPGLTTGATRAEALLLHLKQRGKGPGQILDLTERLFNHKVLPPHLRMEFYFQDDAQDRQVADIRKVRAERRSLDLNSGALTLRAARETMFYDGEITAAEFHDMELRDGRTIDGYDVTALFYKDDPYYKKYLDLGVPDPLDFYKVNPIQLLPLLNERLASARTEMVNNFNLLEVTDGVDISSIVGALVHLRHIYMKIIETGIVTPEGMQIVGEHEHVFGFTADSAENVQGANEPSNPVFGRGTAGPEPPGTANAPSVRDVRRQDPTTAAIESTTNPREIQRGQMIPDYPTSETGE